MAEQQPEQSDEEDTADVQDTYEITDWEVRTAIDRAAVFIYHFLLLFSKVGLVLTATVILAAELIFSGVALLNNPWVGSMTVFSVVPAFGLAAIIWERDNTASVPLIPLAITYILGIVLASFAAIVNTASEPLFIAIPIVGTALFYFIVVAPGEEFVKWVAIRLHAYSHSSFAKPIDGAVYGAAAGLGFASIENLVYISQRYVTVSEMSHLPEVVLPLFQTAAVRTLAGPGHVIYSAIAGYYLALAKFNGESRGPIIIKGLLIAAVLHATYNTLVTLIPPVISVFTGVPQLIVFVGFVFVFDSVAFCILYRKIKKHREAYDA